MVLRLLTVGTSFGSTWMEAARNSPNWENAGLVARTEKSRREAGKKFNIDSKNQFAELNTAIQQCKDVDAVVIAVPNELHYELAKMVLDNDLHLALEKPITETWLQAVDLVKLLDAHGKKACVGQTLRGEVMLRLMEHFLNQGVIGKIEQLTFECHWWWYNDPTIGRNWRFRLPNMFLDDIGIHQIDTVRMLLENRKCNEIFAMTHTPTIYPIKELKATALGGWNMEDDIPVSYFGSMGAKGKDVGWFGCINVFGEKGSMFRNAYGQPYLYLDGKKEPIGLDDKYGDDIDEYLPLVEFERISYILEDFYHAIKDDRPPVTDLHDNINSYAILLGMKRSAEEKRLINIQQEFPLP